LNTEIEHQWRLTQNQLPEEDFVSAFNFFHNIRNPELSETQTLQKESHDLSEEQGQDEDFDEEGGLDEADKKQHTHRFIGPKRKIMKLCHHKLQRMATSSHRTKTKQPRLQGQYWQGGPEGLELIYEPDWNQL